ncbi:MAG: sialidase [Opitutus sp.]|nr:sialidase [Opitutus sp.]
MRVTLSALATACFTLVIAGLPAGAQPSLPADLAPYFRPPTSATEKLDRRHSPLVRPDGSRIATAAEWTLERAAIRRRWFQLMGPWPELLAAPTLEIVRTESRENFEQQWIRLELAPGLKQDAILLLPRGAGPFPAVVVPFYDPATSAGLGGKSLRDFGYQLARRGFVALCLGAPGGDAYQPTLAGAQCQPLSFLAYLAANAHTALTRLPFVDASRIGIVGHSYGGKWAMFASCLYDKFACAVWSDPGIVFDETRPSINYQEPWYLGLDPTTTRPRGLVSATAPRTGAYQQLIAQGHDLHELHALMAPRPFLVSGGAEDSPARWPALTHAIAVNHLLGAADRVAMTHRPAHDPTAESNAIIYRFLEHFLRSRSAR